MLVFGVPLCRFVGSSLLKNRVLFDVSLRAKTVVYIHMYIIVYIYIYANR